MNKKLLFSCGDDAFVEFPLNLKDFSSFLTDSLECADFDGEEDVIVPISNYSSGVVCKMIEFYNYYKDKPYTYLNKPLKTPYLSENISDTWYSTFIENISEDFLLDLMDCANFFDFNPLLELCCARAGAISFLEDLKKEEAEIKV